LWAPLARAAHDLAGFDPPDQPRPARPLGTYTTLLTNTGLVVKLFGDRWSGPESHQAGLEAYQVLDGHDLPVPRLIGGGQLFPDATGNWPWPFLILTGLQGATYAALAATLDPPARRRATRDVGRLPRRLDCLPLGGRPACPQLEPVSGAAAAPQPGTAGSSPLGGAAAPAVPPVDGRASGTRSARPQPG